MDTVASNEGAMGRVPDATVRMLSGQHHVSYPILFEYISKFCLVEGAVKSFGRNDFPISTDGCQSVDHISAAVPGHSVLAQIADLTIIRPVSIIGNRH